MTEYWNGGITGVSMNRGKSFLGLSGLALVAQNAFGLGLAKDQVRKDVDTWYNSQRW